MMLWQSSTDDVVVMARFHLGELNSLAKPPLYFLLALA